MTDPAQLALTVCSPWQWFCSTRTLSNCLETTLTVTALNLWPWYSACNRREGDGDAVLGSQEQADEDYVHVGEGSPHLSEEPVAAHPDGNKTDAFQPREQSTQYYNLRKSLRSSLLLAALACILRPTNILIWICLICFATLRTRTYGRFMEIRWVKSPVWVHITSLELFPATHKERKDIIIECVTCGYWHLQVSGKCAVNANI